MTSPRFWLIIWGAIGTLFLIYVIISSSVKPNNAPGLNNSTRTAYLTGEMADFSLTFPPRKAPEIPFSYDDKTLTLKEFRGKVTLVNFWATWCAPCLKELPSLDQLQSKLADKEFEIVAIAADPRGPDVAQSFLEKLNISNLKLYADPRLLFASAIGGANVLPVSILYDAKGNEIGRLVGEADWNSPEAERLILGILHGETIKK